MKLPIHFELSYVSNNIVLCRKKVICIVLYSNCRVIFFRLIMFCDAY